jgi:hypothetical protein
VFGLYETSEIALADSNFDALERSLFYLARGRFQGLGLGARKRK